MKKKILISLVTLLSISLCSCGQQTQEVAVSNEAAPVVEENVTEEVAEPEYCDQEFIDNFAEAIDARWKSIEDQNNRDSGEEYTFEKYVSDLRENVDAEREILQDFRDKKFEDSLLMEYAVTYLNGLDEQVKILDTAEEETFDDEWEKAYMKRYQALINIYDNYDIKIDARYNQNIDMIRNSLYVKEIGEDGMFNMLNDTEKNEMISEKASDDDTAWEYEFSLYNSSEYEFKSFPVYLYIVDPDKDELVEYVEYDIGDWKPGEKAFAYFTSQGAMKALKAEPDKVFSVFIDWR